MKRTFALFFAFALAVTAFAQTPEEIIARMEAEMEKHEKDGLIMTMDVKIPIIGTMSTKVYALGEKSRIEAKVKGEQIITWSDEETEWEYNSKKNEIEITRVRNSSGTSNDGGEAELFTSVADGYDVTLKKETADAWFFVCKKNKDNKDKDAPKTMELDIAKGSYLPLRLSAKISGLGMTMRDISFGVTEEQVTFNPKDYPTARIIDKR